MEILDDIFAGARAFNNTSDLVGRALSVKYAIVQSVNDPLNLGRIKVLEPEKGAKTESDWLMCATVYSGLTVPIPKAGDTALIGYINGDPHDGVYFGVIHNLINPPSDVNSLTLNVGSVKIVITPDGHLSLSGVTTVTCDSPNVNYINTTSFSINGNQVLTLGSRDNAGKVNITTGWS